MVLSRWSCRWWGAFMICGSWGMSLRGRLGRARGGLIGGKAAWVRGGLVRVAHGGGGGGSRGGWGGGAAYGAVVSGGGGGPAGRGRPPRRYGAITGVAGAVRRGGSRHQGVCAHRSR